MDASRLAPLALGVAFHALVRRLEIDMFILPLSGVFGALGLAHLYLSVHVFGSPIPTALWALSRGTALFAAGLAASMLLYRGLFHRLRAFPGPAAARLTKLYAVWLSARRVQWHLELQQLHARHGDVVRTGPRELTVFRAEAVAPVAACRKSTLYQLSDWSDDRLGLIETRDVEDHRRRRRPWEMALSTKAIGVYDARMQEIVGTFLSILSRSKEPVNVTELVAYLSYDLMGAVGFGRDFGQLAGGGVEHWAVKTLRAQQMFFGVLKPIPWLMNAASQIPGADRAVAPFVDYCKGLVSEKMKVWMSHLLFGRPLSTGRVRFELQKKLQDGRIKMDREILKVISRHEGNMLTTLLPQTLKAEKADNSQPTDILSWILQEYEARTPHAPRTQAALDEDGRTIVVAGA